MVVTVEWEVFAVAAAMEVIRSDGGSTEMGLDPLKLVEELGKLQVGARQPLVSVPEVLLKF